MLYRRGTTWWFKFRFAGRLYRESAKTTSKTLAREAERQRRRDLEEGYHGIRRRPKPVILSVAAEEWLDAKKPQLAPKSHQIEKTNLGHLKPRLGALLITDIDAADISRYQDHRLREGASPKTINLEVGTLRAVLRKHRLWAHLQPDVRMLPTRDDVGRAITEEEEQKLLAACGTSRSRALLPAVTLALNTGMRYDEIRTLKWKQVDLERRTVTVGKSKTQSGTGRTIPLNDRAHASLRFWAEQFPARKAEHYVFPTERYGLAGHTRQAHVFDTDPTTPVKSLKEAWESAKEKAGVVCRFHDLRHTITTRFLERGVPLPVVASILGWSAATTVRMAKRYGHIGQAAQRRAVDGLVTVPSEKAPTDERDQEQAGRLH